MNIIVLSSLIILFYSPVFCQSEVQIGNHIWMKENLNVDSFRNGDKLYYARTIEEWKEANEGKVPAYHYFQFDENTNNDCGKLYNWYAINDIRQLAPVGYHIPSKDEWDKLQDYNQFNIKPCGNGGVKSFDLDSSYGHYAYWWSSTEFGSYQGWYRKLRFENMRGDHAHTKKEEGMSVRCVKDYIQDSEIKSSISKTSDTIESVQIGDQVWMSKNLDVSTFRNGDKIKEAKTNNEWISASKNKEPAWCYLKDDAKNGARFGKLYNWYAVNDSRGIAPIGWKIPTETEWQILIDYSGGSESGSIKLKKHQYWIIEDDKMNYQGSSSTITKLIFYKGNWLENGEIINRYRFSALPGGMRYYNGHFTTIKNNGYWWTSTPYQENSALLKVMFSDSDQIKTLDYYKSGGLSVRCIKE